MGWTGGVRNTNAKEVEKVRRYLYECQMWYECGLGVVLLLELLMASVSLENETE